MKEKRIKKSTHSSTSGSYFHIALAAFDYHHQRPKQLQQYDYHIAMIIAVYKQT